MLKRITISSPLSGTNPLRPGGRSRVLSIASGLAILLLPTLPVVAATTDEENFATPQDAVNALVAAAKNHDTKALDGIFGPEEKELISPDLVQATNESTKFVKCLTQKTKLIKKSDTSFTLEMGADNWPFPLPLVKKDGKWSFDTDAGKQEILCRRIGRDEIGAMRVCRAYVAAQREYASEDRMGDGVLAYAQLLHSTVGKHDGLFWASKPGETLSPLGPLITEAHAAGYHRTGPMLNNEQAPYHGYYFKILTSQGKSAPCGAYDYIINDHLIAGFALIAWPAEWGKTGVMTFVVNQQCRIYQKNFGPSSFEEAQAITAYAPNSTWTPAQ
jgi:hypothetical protein